MFKYFLILMLLIIFVPSVRKFLFWLLVGRSISKEQRKANEQFNKNQAKEGEIRVEKKPDSNKQHFDGGEYVDYEEVK